ncbi:hypothetical protein PoB_002448000 [Plakobranchus ocellatus]|uniref:Uncharacterized protein n=1 Tax=Plakobranchus ocellatus TaxID=259542 RepID=A0AAV3ZTL8_9GAST|nr:hypothetical protein PoB_002448000 [Plakobranchus ocellatus]
MEANSRTEGAFTFKIPLAPLPPATGTRSSIGQIEEAKWEQLVKRLAIGWLHTAKVRHDSEAGLGAAHAVVLLQQPRVALYAAIARQLKRRDAAWLQTFLEHHGLEILFVTLEAIRSNSCETLIHNPPESEVQVTTTISEQGSEYFSPQGETSSDRSADSKGDNVSKTLTSLCPTITITPAAAAAAAAAGTALTFSSTLPSSPSLSSTTTETRTGSNSGNSSLFRVLLQVGCVECISLVMDSQQSLEYIIENDEFIKRFATGCLKIAPVAPGGYSWRCWPQQADLRLKGIFLARALVGGLDSNPRQFRLQIAGSVCQPLYNHWAFGALIFQRKSQPGGSSTTRELLYTFQVASANIRASRR